LMSSGTMADPIKPVAPVRNTRMLFCPSAPFGGESVTDEY
jgi:hypothetical protein